MTVSDKLHRNIKLIDSILGIIKSISSAPKLDISSLLNYESMPDWIKT